MIVDVGRDPIVDYIEQTTHPLYFCLHFLIHLWFNHKIVLRKKNNI